MTVIREAVSNIAGVFASGFDTLVQEFGDPDRLSLKAKPSPSWDGTSGIMAYGECPQIAGHTGDKTWVAKVFVPNAAFCVFGEAAAGRITCTPSGSGWKAGGTVFTADGTATLLSAELALSSVDPTYVAVTYNAATGETKLFLAGVEENDTTFGEARDTIEALPIWRVGAPPEGWVTDFAVFDRILAPEEMPGFVAPVTVTINKGGAQADPAPGTSPVVFDVVFSEAVSGFATGDVTLSGTAGATTATVVDSGDHINFTVNVTGMTTTGTVIASIGAAVCTAVSDGRPNAASTSTDNNVQWDLVFTDDFNRSNRSLSGDNGWSVGTSIGAAADIVSNEAVGGGSNGCWVYRTTSPISNADHYAAIDMVSGLAGDIGGVFCRYTDNNNFYIGRCAAIGTDQYQLYKRVGGTYTLLSSLTEAFPAQPFRVRLWVNGTSLKFQLWNGSSWVDKCTATDSAHSTGKFGFFHQQIGSTANYDNFEGGNS